MRSSKVDPARIKAVWEKVHENIATHGWHLTGVFSDGKSSELCYSVGGWDKALPELIITGLSFRTAAVLLNTLLGEACKGLELKEGVAYAEIANFPLYLKALTPEQSRAWMSMTWNYHTKGKATSKLKEPFLAYQVVYPDPAGRFPWDEGYQFPMQELCWLPKAKAPGKKGKP